ncbi:hypothetical protein HCN44_003213 [Aphidius gifuensis]|uniref:HIT-type domain-containing protein n=1 Tax=Aphidius gifuensis TaxID=684658 RepID=A0A834XMH8_APHGI|nr:zinc finger HIT domain-containing protein 2 [Aphidius gifuensis]KAF7987451.1 hypothetical protein HCN44_003213 [Aphidius gifuensis]
MSENNSSSSINICKICNNGRAIYTCPRCSVCYCSVDCYKSTSHMDCSEEFYKECVELELKNPVNQNDKNKMEEILKRVYQSDGSYPDDRSEDNDDGSDVDSDDDDELPDLAERIKNIDLNNADELWAVLSESERQEFEAIIKNGEEDKILPLWEPWWTKVDEKKLVEVVDESNDTEKKLNNNLPVVMNIPVIESLEKASPLVAYNLLNVLSSYICTVLHYNGEHQNSPDDAVIMFLELNDNIKNNKVFDDSRTAVDCVVNKALELGLLPDDDIDEGKEAIESSLKQIISGPSEQQHNLYILTALSDLHDMFTKAKQKASKEQSNSVSQLPKKMQIKIDDKCVNFMSKKYQFYFKKLEYYLAWVNHYPNKMTKIIIE